MDKSMVCGCTGHRPQKLPWGFNEADPKCERLKMMLEDMLIDLVENKGVRYFISGMALGFDIYFVETALFLKKIFPHITVEAAIPCRSQPDKWHIEDRERYYHILDRVDKTHCVQEAYDSDCMMRRNEYIVNSSGHLAALWDGRPSGTGKTVQMAIKQQLQIIYINPNELAT